MEKKNVGATPLNPLRASSVFLHLPSLWGGTACQCAKQCRARFHCHSRRGAVGAWWVSNFMGCDKHM